jgi:hypothetical protein
MTSQLRAVFSCLAAIAVSGCGDGELLSPDPPLLRKTAGPAQVQGETGPA